MTGSGWATGTMAAVARDRTEPVHDPTALDPEADQESRRRARIWLWSLIGLLVVVVGAISVIGRQRETSVAKAPKAFCKAAKAYEKELDAQAADFDLNVARQIEKVQVIVDTAPKDVRADAQVFLEQLQKIDAAPNQAARAKLQDDPDVKEAVDNVNRRWNQGCDVFKRDSAL